MHKREESRFAAFIGIDWADKKHDFCLWVAGSEKRERLVLEHSPRAIQAWVAKLRERFGGAPIAVSLELAQGPIVSALLEHDFLVLFPIQPVMLARYRNAFTPSRAKDDPRDAELALELLLKHPEKLKRLEPESAAMRSLRRLVEARRSLVEDRTRLTNRITSALKAYFPQVLGWFRDKEAGIFADFLERWPTLDAAQRARSETLADFFRAANVRYAAAVERRIEAINSERALHTDAAVLEPMRLLVEALLPQRAPSPQPSNASTPRSRLSHPSSRSTRSSPRSQVPALRSRLDCSSPLVSAENASRKPQRCRSTPASRL